MFDATPDDHCPSEHDDVTEEIESSYQATAKHIVDNKLSVCLRCKMHVRRRILKKFSTERKGFPDDHMFDVCLRAYKTLHSSEWTGKTLFASDFYKDYTEIFDTSLSGSSKKKRSGSDFLQGRQVAPPAMGSNIDNILNASSGATFAGTCGVTPASASASKSFKKRGIYTKSIDLRPKSY